MRCKAARCKAARCKAARCRGGSGEIAYLEVQHVHEDKKGVGDLLLLRQIKPRGEGCAHVREGVRRREKAWEGVGRSWKCAGDVRRSTRTWDRSSHVERVSRICSALRCLLAGRPRARKSARSSDSLSVLRPAHSSRDVREGLRRSWKGELAGDHAPERVEAFPHDLLVLVT